MQPSSPPLSHIPLPLVRRQRVVPTLSSCRHLVYIRSMLLCILALCESVYISKKNIYVCLACFTARVHNILSKMMRRNKKVGQGVVALVQWDLNACESNGSHVQVFLNLLHLCFSRCTIFALSKYIRGLRSCQLPSFIINMCMRNTRILLRRPPAQAPPLILFSLLFFFSFWFLESLGINYFIFFFFVLVGLFLCVNMDL